MGFGLGSVFVGKLVPDLLDRIGIANTFFALGAAYLAAAMPAALLLENPPRDWIPAGFTPAAGAVSLAGSFTFEEARHTRQWYMLWGMLFVHVSAGLGLLSQLSPMGQEILKQVISDPKILAAKGGLILAIASIFNGLGRIFWASVSDRIGRRNVFLVMFATQAALFVYLPGVGPSTLLFTSAACYLLACYGGGFAVMPAFVADSFGPAHIGKVYGAILTAWGVAGIAGPLVFAQFQRPLALHTAAGLLVVGFMITLAYRHPVKAADAVAQSVTHLMVRIPDPLPASAAGWPAGWDPALLERARRDLAHHTGPIALFLLQRACGRARDPQELHQLLSLEIPDGVDRRAFLAVRSRDVHATTARRARRA